MYSGIQQLGMNLFQHIETIQMLWSRTFGTNYQQVWENPQKVIEEVITTARYSGPQNEDNSLR